MVWNTDDTAFEDGLAISRAYFAVHGHLAAPKPAAVNGYPVGQFLANCRRPLETRRNPERWRERWAQPAPSTPTGTPPDATTRPSGGHWTGNACTPPYACTPKPAAASTTWSPDTPSAAKTSEPGWTGNGAAA
ncbi:Helicase associated domain protein [Embleya sp. NBC_00888]|uniref:Helicase associated domain protein n=1 Tax=Embleya sp. NBC_00888 TaxID=2975960 RepID=UPI002F90BC25